MKNSTHNNRWSFSRDTVERLSWFKSEPSWMCQRRLAAWNIVECAVAQGAMGRMEWMSFEAFTEPPKSGVPSHEWPHDLTHTLAERGDEEGLIIQRDATILSRSITKDAVKRGAMFLDLDMAIKSAPELVRKSLEHQPITEDPWAALHAAFWSGGCFAYVPRHTCLALPLHMCTWLSTPESAVFPTMLVVAEKGAQVQLIDEQLSGNWRQPSLAVAWSDFHVGENAAVSYVNRKNWGAQVLNRTRQTQKVSRGGRLEISTVTGRQPEMTLERVAELYPEVRHV